MTHVAYVLALQSCELVHLAVDGSLQDGDLQDRYRSLITPVKVKSKIIYFAPYLVRVSQTGHLWLSKSYLRMVVIPRKMKLVASLNLQGYTFDQLLMLDT